MASAGTAVKVLLVVAVLVVVATSPDEGTVPRTPNLHPVDGVTLVPSPSSSTNVPGGGLEVCTGDPLFAASTGVGDAGGLSLEVSFAGGDGGRTCALATRTGSAARQRGELTVTLQLHNYDGRRWPRYAVSRQRGTEARSPALYLDDTNGRCVRAKARFAPDRGRAVEISTGKIGCRWSAPEADSA